MNLHTSPGLLSSLPLGSARSGGERDLTVDCWDCCCFSCCSWFNLFSASVSFCCSCSSWARCSCLTNSIFSCRQNGNKKKNWSNITSNNTFQRSLHSKFIPRKSLRVTTTFCKCCSLFCHHSVLQIWLKYQTDHYKSHGGKTEKSYARKKGKKNIVQTREGKEIKSSTCKNPSQAMERKKSFKQAENPPKKKLF